MSAQTDHWPLDPIDRQSEVMFGLLMTLTFTGTMSVALGSGATVRDILLAALGCNIAWGIVDATVYLLTTAAGRARDRAQAAAIRNAPESEAIGMLRAMLPEPAGDQLTDAQAAAMLAWMRRHPPGDQPAAVLRRADFGAALQVFLLVAGATFPPVLPFLLVESVPLAMRLSNAVAVGMLVLIGWNLDREMNIGHGLMRWIMPVIGAAMVAVTVALGG
jgi:hypothetical protein